MYGFKLFIWFKLKLLPLANCTCFKKHSFTLTIDWELFLKKNWNRIICWRSGFLQFVLVRYLLWAPTHPISIFLLWYTSLLKNSLDFLFWLARLVLACFLNDFTNLEVTTHLHHHWSRHNLLYFLHMVNKNSYLLIYRLVHKHLYKL